MRNVRSDKAHRLRAHLLRWYRVHRRDLPWRRTRNPYRILVSEVMLQQTQVARVIDKFPLFLKQFPTVYDLAASTSADAIRAWQGMGYNNRVLRLKECARQIVEKHRGRVPANPRVLASLPGVGMYTAHAVACFAYHQPVPVVDVNIRRVISRVFWRMWADHETKDQGKVWSLAEEILPKHSAHEWNQALMELGATVCRSRSPRCHECPLRRWCASRSSFSRANGASSTRRKNKERLYAGIPYRIYRGRIVEKLRALHRHGAIELAKLGKAVKTDFRGTELPWLSELVAKLEREGLVMTERRGGSLRVSLPEG